jgi:hypothetical protein
MTATDALLLSAGCTLADWDWTQKAPPGLVACGEPVIAEVTFACIHEHVDRALACAACACELQRTAEFLICSRCEDGASPHQCPQTMQIRWLAEEGTEAR